MANHATWHVYRARRIKTPDGSRELTHVEKVVLPRLLFGGSDDGLAMDVSWKMLAEDTCLKRRAVAYAMSGLCCCPKKVRFRRDKCGSPGGACELHLGALKVVGLFTREGHVWHRYKLDLAMLLDENGDALRCTVCTSRGARGAPLGVHVVHPLLEVTSSNGRGAVSEGVPAPNSSSSNKRARARQKQTTTTKGLKELSEALLDLPLSGSGETFDAQALAELLERCRERDAHVTVEAIVNAVNQKIKTNHFARRPVRSWVGFLLTVVPRCFGNEVMQ